MRTALIAFSALFVFASPALSKPFQQCVVDGRKVISNYLCPPPVQIDPSEKTDPGQTIVLTMSPGRSSQQKQRAASLPVAKTSQTVRAASPSGGIPADLKKGVVKVCEDQFPDNYYMIESCTKLHLEAMTWLNENARDAKILRHCTGAFPNNPYMMKSCYQLQSESKSRLYN